MKSRRLYTFKVVAVFAVCFVIAFMPFSVNLNKYMVSLESHKAYADAGEVATAFIEGMAGAAGLSSSAFVATVSGATSIATGMKIGTEGSIDLGGSLANNLEALCDAADYPNWSTLTQSQQESYGTKENYDAAKFNSLMAGFGMGDAYERYQNSWGESDDFGFTTSEKTKLQQIGRIGKNWSAGIGNSVSEVRNLVNNVAAINNWYPGDSYRYTKTEEDVNYPETVPNTVSFSSASNIYLNLSGRNIGSATFSLNRAVYCIVIYQQPYKQSYYYNYPFKLILFDKVQFNGTNGLNQVVNSVKKTVNDQDFYFYDVSGTSSNNANNAQFESNVAINGPADITYQGEIYLAYYMLYGESKKDFPLIDEYPQQEIDSGALNDTEVYYPDDGININVNWNDFTTPSQTPVNPDKGIFSLLRHIDSDLHKFKFYGNGDLKVHDSVVLEKLSDIYSLLQQISSKLGSGYDVSDAPEIIGDFDFDEIENKVPDLLETISDLAPFGSILLLSEMYSIMANFTKIEDPEMTFPFNFGMLGNDVQNELVIDLSWLNDIKPLINFICIGLLIIAIANATIRIVEIEAAS